MDDTTRRKICELVTGIIATDQELHPAELRFMLRTFSAFGVASGKDDEAICPTVHSAEAARAMRELPQAVRQEALELLVRSAVVDGKVVPAERQFLEAVAHAAELSLDGLDERLAEALRAAEGHADPEI